jgi:sulfur transfer protein SufE
MKALQPQRLRGFSHVTKTMKKDAHEPYMNHKLQGKKKNPA